MQLEVLDLPSEKPAIDYFDNPFADKISPDLRTREKVVEALLSGLNTDGGHHKQYYLEEALRLKKK